MQNYFNQQKLEDLGEDVFTLIKNIESIAKKNLPDLERLNFKDYEDGYFLAKLEIFLNEFFVRSSYMQNVISKEVELKKD